MKAQKVTVEIKVQGLSIDILPGMLSDVLEQVEKGAETGLLRMDDGDEVEWKTSRENVKI